jgi:hypothetical protein
MFVLILVESCFGFCTDESPVNEPDLQMGEQLPEPCNKCNELAYRDSENVNGSEFYLNYRDIIISPKRAQQKHEVLNFSPDAMLK